MSSREIRSIDEIDRASVIAEISRVIREELVEKEGDDRYSRWLEVDTDVLQDALTLLQASAEDLLATDAGLALANAAWQEGAAARYRYEQMDFTGDRPDSPYSAPLLARIKARRKAHSESGATQS